MSVELRELAVDELTAVSTLVARVFDRPAPADGAARLGWLLYENPDAARDIAKGWVLWDAGDPVGFLANVARAMIVNGRDVRAACTARFVTLASHRFHGLRLAKAYFEQTSADLLLISTGSEASVPVLRRFGARDIAGGQNAAMFVLRASAVVAELLRRRGYGDVVRSAMAAGAGGVLTLLERAKRQWPRCPPDVRIERVPRFDRRADELGNASRRDGWITSRREAGRLNWLFVDGPSSRPATSILAAYRGERLAGYLVNQDRDRTVRRREVMDVFVGRDDGDVFDALVGEAGRHAEQEEKDTLEFRHIPTGYVERLTAWGARRRRLGVNPFLALPRRADLELPTDVASAWHLVPADGDGAGW